MIHPTNTIHICFPLTDIQYHSNNTENVILDYFTYRDALLTSAVNCFTSFLAGFAVFSVLGHMAFKQHKSVENVSREGKEIAQMYPMSNQSNVPLKYQLYTVIEVTFSM